MFEITFINACKKQFVKEHFDLMINIDKLKYVTENNDIVTRLIYRNI